MDEIKIYLQNNKMERDGQTLPLQIQAKTCYIKHTPFINTRNNFYMKSFILTVLSSSCSHLKFILTVWMSQPDL